MNHRPETAQSGVNHEGTKVTESLNHRDTEAPGANGIWILCVLRAFVVKCLSGLSSAQSCRAGFNHEGTKSLEPSLIGDWILGELGASVVQSLAPAQTNRIHNPGLPMETPRQPVVWTLCVLRAINILSLNSRDP